MKNSNIAIQLENVSKRYFKQGQRTLKELIHDVLVRKASPGKFLWALKNISLTVKKGESIGIIGKNGSGKSTILKIIAGVTRPTEGKMSIHGKIAPLIELGSGFHPELTGKENIYLNASILGMKKDEVDKKFQDIVNFAELQNFIDTPVKYYSSGMYLRLAFAVAIYVNADILLIDEILAVGDTAFQQKCLAKIEEFKRSGKTIIMVSHSMDQIGQYCDKVLLLSNGQILKIGPAKSVINAYMKERG